MVNDFDASGSPVAGELKDPLAALQIDVSRHEPDTALRPSALFVADERRRRRLRGPSTLMGLFRKGFSEIVVIVGSG
eukprot:2785712-Pleurochrysis_carterae.AAC.1